MTKEKLTEILSYYEHESWAKWMKYLFSKCEFDNSGNAIIPSKFAEQWTRQMNTPYNELSKLEKESDREEVYKILPVIDGYIYRNYVCGE